MNIAQLRETRAAKVTEMRTLADADDMNETQAAKFDELKAEVRTLDEKIGRAEHMAELERTAPAIVNAGNMGDGAYEDRARGFSLVKAINARLGEDVDAGFEREISAEVRRRSGRTFQGIAVPDEYFQVERRTLTVGGGGDAASLYPTQHRGDLFIDMLRSQLVTGRLGATVLDGLVGDQDIPKQTASSTAQWVGEDGALTETDADFDDVSLSPKTVGAITSYSRRTLINAVPSIEQIVRNDLAAVVARAIDARAMLGDGSGNTPVGVVNQSDVHELTLAGPTWAQVLDFIASIQSDDAEIGSMGWAMTPKAVKAFRQTLRETGDAGAGYLMEQPGSLAGYAAATTTALPDVDGEDDHSTVIFGAWSQLLVGSWTGTDILVNPFEGTAYSRGRVLMRAMRDVDVAVRHGEAFAYADYLDVGNGS